MIRPTDPAAPTRRSAVPWTLVAALAVSIVPAATADEAGGGGAYLAFIRAAPRPSAPATRRRGRSPTGPNAGRRSAVAWPGRSGRSPTRPRARSHQPRHARPRRLPRREGDVPDPARGPDDREPLPAGIARPAPGDPGRPRPLARGEAGPGRAGPLHRRGEARVRRPRGRRLRRRRAGRRQGARRVPRRDDRRDALAHRPDPRRPPGLRERPRARLPRHPARGRRGPRRGHRRQRRGQPDDVCHRDDRRPEGGRPRLLGGQLPELPGDRLLHVRARPRGPDVHRGVGRPRARRAQAPDGRQCDEGRRPVLGPRGEEDDRRPGAPLPPVRAPAAPASCRLRVGPRLQQGDARGGLWLVRSPPRRPGRWLADRRAGDPDRGPRSPPLLPGRQPPRRLRDAAEVCRGRGAEAVRREGRPVRRRRVEGRGGAAPRGARDGARRVPRRAAGLPADRGRRPRPGRPVRAGAGPAPRGQGRAGQGGRRAPGRPPRPRRGRGGVREPDGRRATSGAAGRS